MTIAVGRFRAGHVLFLYRSVYTLVLFTFDEPFVTIAMLSTSVVETIALTTEDVTTLVFTLSDHLTFGTDRFRLTETSRTAAHIRGTTLSVAGLGSAVVAGRRGALDPGGLNMTMLTLQLIAVVFPHLAVRVVLSMMIAVAVEFWTTLIWVDAATVGIFCLAAPYCLLLYRSVVTTEHAASLRPFGAVRSQVATAVTTLLIALVDRTTVV